MKRGLYTEVDTEKFLKKYVAIAKHRFVHTQRDAEAAARALGFPLVLKLISPGALHKSEVKGVRLVKNKVDFEHEYRDLVKIAKKKKLRLDGILVQEFVEGQYVLIGLKKDPVFGHVIVFGVGGVYTELLKDVAFRVCPINVKDAQSMIDELQMKELLYGFRGEKKANISKLKETLVKISKIPSKYPEIKEMDINPFVINHKRGVVVDARMKV
tara:strand:- start:3136 stop:3774 length:639 start_codon:yes stop_codon:yes gene_type:complete